MDILKRYNEQYSKSYEEPLKRELPQEFDEAGALMRFVVRLSGGRVRDVRQAGFVLLGFVGLCLIVSMFLLFGAGSAKFSPDWTPYLYES